MSFMDRLETRFGDDVLLHYGVKGMKWKEQKKKEKEDASSKKQGYKTEGRAKSANVEDKRKTSASDADKTDVQWIKDVTRTYEGMLLNEKRIKKAERKGAVTRDLIAKKRQAIKSVKYNNSVPGKIDKILKKMKDKVISKKRPKKRKVTITTTSKPMFSHSIDSIMDMKTSEVLLHSGIEIQHYGIKGMRWGVSRRHKRASIKAFRAQGLDKATSKSIYKTQTKALNKQLKKANELPDMVKKSNKKAVRVIRKDGKALEVSTNLLTKKRLFRQTRITGYQKQKLEAVLDTPMKEINRGSRKKVEKIMAKYKNLDVRVVTSDTMKDPNGGWVRLDGKKELNQSATNQDIITLQHHGIKGMRWGVRNSRRSSKSVNTSKKAEPTKPGNLKNPVNRLKAEISSAKREASWGKKATGDMSNRDLTRLSKRIQLENNLKGLVGKKEYLVRADVSTKDLKARVDRLQLQKNLKLQSNIANKANIDRANAIVKSVSNVTVDVISKKSPNINAAIRKEMTNVTINKISKKTKIPKDIIDAAVKSVQGEYDTAKAEAAANAPPKAEKTARTTKTEDSKTYTGKVYKTVDDLKKRKRP